MGFWGVRVGGGGRWTRKKKQLGVGGVEYSVLTSSRGQEKNKAVGV